MKISYCTVVSNRLDQLKQTLPENIKFTRSKRTEIVLLVWNDTMGTADYVKQEYAEFIKTGRLVVVEVNEPEKEFDLGYLKDKVIQSSKGKIIFNLDADNFIGQAHEQLSKLQADEVLKTEAPINDGRNGRCGMYRELYDSVGGYTPGKDVADLVIRLKMQKKAKVVECICNIPPTANPGIIDFD